MADYGYMLLYGRRLKSMSAGLDCGLGGLSVTHSASEAA